MGRHTIIPNIQSQKMKVIALAGALALVAAKPNIPPPPGDYEAEFGLTGYVSSSKKCDAYCKENFEQIIEHHNQKIGIFKDFNAKYECGNLKVKKFPKEYTTQIVGGEKFIFKNFVLEGEKPGCEKFKVDSFEIVNQSWIEEKPWNWPSIKSDLVTDSA